ncbi:MAG: nuclear transport factor 2 family protein [Haliea sp.]|uniref:nuclear transport factor 2 family protein n=1 Tax=Haliea sp. TaxID=1932666 RepID=UPI0032EC559A
MDLEVNKQLVLDFWKAFSESRFDDALEMVADDGTWWVPGSGEGAGEYAKDEFAASIKGIGEYAPNGIRVTVSVLTAEGDRVAMEAECYGKLANGKVYNNFIHVLHMIRDGKLVKIREYMDTQHVREVFG